MVAQHRAKLVSAGLLDRKSYEVNKSIFQHLLIAIAFDSQAVGAADLINYLPVVAERHRYYIKRRAVPPVGFVRVG